MMRYLPITISEKAVFAQATEFLFDTDLGDLERRVPIFGNCTLEFGYFESELEVQRFTDSL